MRGLFKPILLVCLALAVPIVPFLSFGQRLEQAIEQSFDPPPPPAIVATLTVAVLASDIFLPVPSSLVSTAAGAELGVGLGCAASWLGMTLGAAAGFALAKTFGRRIAQRFSAAEDFERMDELALRYGRAILIFTRPLPILAEAAVLCLGCTQLTWRRFMAPMMLSNLGIAVVYSALGELALSQGELPLALAASIALPVLAAAITRRFLPEAT